MKAEILQEKYKKLKQELQDNESFNQQQKDMYLLGWLDCSLFVIKEIENDYSICFQQHIV